MLKLIRKLFTRKPKPLALTLPWHPAGAKYLFMCMAETGRGR